MNSETLKLIENFEGVIGAVFGVAVTLILTTILKNVGKLKVFPPIIKIYCQKTVEDGTTEEVELSQAEFASFDIDIDLYNSSETLRVLRDLRISFFNSDSLLLEIKPDDNSTKRHNGHWLVRDGFTVFNVQPKSMEQISLHVGLSNVDTANIRDYSHFKLSFKNHKSKIQNLIIHSR